MFRVALLLWFSLCSGAASSSALPRPAGLEPAVQFWTRIYTEVSTRQGYLHDASNLAVVYQTLSFPPGLSPAQQNDRIAASKRQYRQALAALGSGKQSALSELEARVQQAWPVGTDAATFRQAAENVRFQRGQSDRFRAGVVRAGQWKSHIRAVLARHELPAELEVLPHVESSFNPNAWSKAAAAGMWQFMPATAQRYMLVDSIVDQRMDPYVSTEAAAALLKRNYQLTGSWPLALTAYNVGANGMMRATRAVGTTDIALIVAKYRGSNFGFASRNFYASFLAALEVDRNAAQYFGDLQPAAPLSYDTVTTTDYVPAAALARTVGVGVEELRQYNPSLLEPVWTGEKYIPRDFQLRLPQGQRPISLSEALAAIPASLRYDHQQPDVLHRIAGGESLSIIARRYNTSVATLMSLNGLRDAHRIRAGQDLRLPGVIPSSRGATRTASIARRPAGAGADNYVVQRGDSLWSIARRLGVSQRQLVSLNNIDKRRYLKPGQRLQIPSAETSGTGTYVIRSGDSLWEIARRFNLSHQDLAAWNNLGNKHSIQPGQVLKLAAVD
ncbi:LysM peptidoglycan-binding domain-containing protein [Kineobactrum salinum]|uniref:LysM peptidoglycan-binding domain-containing protein n=1 Tax=Kineobactrum salinum TaxID=2708301 RepID=A0A6C0TXR4_9GAMM|nr:LysM peptidoglycan-binding domain-containing protein [Kineobactrum salinum]QIB64428.1 LysM peptidoglycan-binding domain-containing protein [Kineobactrum salinum]